MKKQTVEQKYMEQQMIRGTFPNRLHSRRLKHQNKKKQ